MTQDEVREVIMAGLVNDERVLRAEQQGDDAIGVEDTHGETHWITVESA